MAILTKRNKNYSRPKKSGAAKRRRELVQRRRLVALGVPAAQVCALNNQQRRAMLKQRARRPKSAGA